MAPVQDIFNLGAEARMNIPGRVEGNWSWRSTEKVLSAADFHPLGDLTRSTNRLHMLPSLAIEMAEAAL
jgi:4-alpha-glucanotransferase